MDVKPDSSLDEIKAKYYLLAQEYHPDKNPHNVEKFKEISEAYRVLKDPSKVLYRSHAEADCR